MEAVVRRDSDAMAKIYERYESTLRPVILNVLHEEGETDDVLHDVFIQLWNHADRFVAEKGLHGFLVTLARRRALDRLRRRLAYRRATDRMETQMKTHRIFYPCEILDTRLPGIWSRPKVEARAPNVSQRAKHGASRSGQAAYWGNVLQ